MTRLMYRKNERTRLTRMLSLVLAVVFTLSFTGLGRVFATDDPVGQSPAADSVAAPSDPAPEEAAPEGGEAAQPEAPAEEPVVEKSDPAPEAQVDEGEDEGDDRGDDKAKDDGEDEDDGEEGEQPPDGEPPYDPGGYETVEGNPQMGENCFKFYDSGTYEIELDDGTMVTIVVTIEDTEDGEFVSWTSTEPVDNVIVKGGPNANIYGGGTSGSGLHAPLNRGNDEMWPDVSYIAFCFGEGGGGGEEPTGAINVLKFNDENGNGVQDEGEEPLEGWTFVLTNMEDEELATLVTDEDGMVHFTALEDGEYMVSEVLEEGWEVTTGSVSQTVTIDEGEAEDLVFGNRMMAEQMWMKSFRLHIDGDLNVAVDGYGVAFELDGEAQELMLVGSLPDLFINMDVPDGSVISGWQFFAMVDGEQVWLTEAGGEETITQDTVNDATFTPGEICGTKYVDADFDEAGPGDADDELGAGVTLILNGPGLDDYEVVTDENGAFCFEGLLPGDYVVSEPQMPLWSVVYPAMWPAEVTLGLGEMSAELDIVNQPPMAAIDVEKTVNVDTAEPGDMVTWTITITNTGMVPIEHFTLYDELLGLDEDVVDYLAPGESHTMDVEYMIPLDAEAGMIVNTVEILAYPEVGNPIPGEDSAEVEVVVPEAPMVEVTKSADVDTVAPGGLITYTVTITNTSDVAATDFTVIDDYDENMVTVVDPGLATDNGDTLMWSWAGLELAPGATVSDSYTVMVDGDLLDGDLITNTVSIPEFGTEDTETVTVVAPEVPMVEVTKSADVDTVAPGGQITYTVTITNTSDVAATDFTVIDDYDEGMVTVVDPGLATDNGDTLTWSWAGIELAAGATVTDSYTVTADADLLDGDLITNTVTIPEFGSEDTETVEVVVPATPMVEVTKLADVETVLPGGEINYTVTYINTSEAVADDFTIIDDYPEDLVTITDTGGATDNGDTLTWLITDPLAPGEERTVSYTAVADADLTTGTQILNTVTIPEFETSDSEIVIVGENVVPGGITISKTANRGTVEPGGFITYTISYTNTGDVTLNDFTIVDDYPEDFVTISDPNGGVVAGGMITWTVNTPLDPGQTRSFNYLVRANGDLPVGTNITNVATIVEFDVSDTATVEVVAAQFLPFTPTGTSAPFLPFTGQELLATLFAIMLSAMLGVALRLAGRKVV